MDNFLMACVYASLVLCGVSSLLVVCALINALIKWKIPYHHHTNDKE